MTRRVLLILFSLIAALASAQEQTSRPAHATTASSFGWVDVYLDPRNKPLAAYQVEFVIADDAATVVGIEGGDAAAFKQPPYYDAAAMSQSRVILAAFSTGSDLPAARSRVARVHVQFQKPDRKYTAKLITAATADGGKIPAEVSVTEGAQP
jgi:hypothetical protein